MSTPFSSTRAVALATIASALTLGFASGAFGTFSPTILSGHSCSAYGWFSGHGYGYNCTPNSGGGGGGSSSYTPPVAAPTTPTTTTPPTPTTTTPRLTTVSGPIVVVASDISGTKYKTALQTLVSNGLMNNTPRIFPTRPITRAEFMKILANTNGFKPVTITKKFGDVPSSNDLAQYIYFGVHMGWVNKRNADFRPNDPISQGEVTKLINAIKGSATADTVVSITPRITRGKAAQDIVDAFLGK